MSRDGPRILIVDDEPALRQYVRSRLQRAMPSASVLVTSTPLEALRLIESGHVDLVVSDHHMPGGDGRVLLSRIRALRPETIRILFTAGADAEADRRGLASGDLHAIVRKPVSGEEIVETVRRLLGEPPAPPADAPVAARDAPATEQVGGARRVLVVDDVVEIGMVMASVARRASAGVDVVVETDALAAAARIPTEPFDVIVCDYRMPNLTGIALLALARRHRPGAKRILITGYNELQEAPEALDAASVDAYVHKPPSLQAMLQLFRHALSEDPSALDTYRDQARIIEREALREQGPLKLEDS